MLLVSISIYVPPVFIGMATADAISGDTSRIPLWAGIVAGLAVFGWLAGMVQQLVMARVGTQLLYELRSKMYEHMQGLSLSFYDEMEVGRMISRLTSDVTVMQELLSTGSLTFAADIVGIFIAVTILMQADWTLALYTFAIVPPLIFILMIWARYAPRGVHQRPHPYQRALRQPRRKPSPACAPCSPSTARTRTPAAST